MINFKYSTLFQGHHTSPQMPVLLRVHFNDLFTKLLHFFGGEALSLDIFIGSFGYICSENS